MNLLTIIKLGVRNCIKIGSVCHLKTSGLIQKSSLFYLKIDNQGKTKLDYWKAPEDLKAGTIPPINYEKILKKRKKGENEFLRNTYKHKKRTVRN